MHSDPLTLLRRRCAGYWLGTLLRCLSSEGTAKISSSIPASPMFYVEHGRNQNRVSPSIETENIRNEPGVQGALVVSLEAFPI